MSTLTERARTAYELTRDLLRVDTTPPGNETLAADIVRRYLRDKALDCAYVEKERGRSNLIARGGGSGPALMLASHLDVVPVVPERWTQAPFKAQEVNGYLYGRGTIDMKQMAAMTAVIAAEAAARNPQRGVLYVAVADEETGCAAGSKFLVEKHPGLIRAEYMIGEGGGVTQYAAGVKFYPIGVAEKGRMLLRLFYKSKLAGHASMPHPENAVFLAGRGLGRLSPGSMPVHVTPASRAFFRRLGTLAGPKGLPLAALSVPYLSPAVLRLLPQRAAVKLRPLLTHTISPTRFKGSDAVNVIPDVVQVDLDIRVLPGFNQEDVLGELWDALGEEVEYEVLDFLPAVASDFDTELFSCIGDAVGKEDPGARALPYLVPGMTDAHFYRALGTKCYGFAPLVLNEEDAGKVRFRMHGHDECIAIDSFMRGYAMLEDAVFSFLKV